MTIKCAECQRRFAPARRDAVYCSERCRVAAWRHRDREAAPPADQVHSDPNLIAPGELEDGWRRVGPYVIPPADPRLTFRAD
jgi:endogenous inhibitor of DNA gyrase (YacG/DUF329 family)